MLHPSQFKFPHIYARAANLPEVTYRAYLRELAGVNSCSDASFEQAGFEAVMAALETVLWDRVDRGLVPDPRRSSRYISSRDYWRRKQPPSGMMTTRQSWLIRELWRHLQPWLPADDRNPAYLDGIIRKAISRQPSNDIRSAEAAAIISALQDRLSSMVASHEN